MYTLFYPVLVMEMFSSEMHELVVTNKKSKQSDTSLSYM